MALQDTFSELLAFDLLTILHTGQRSGYLILEQAPLRAMLWFLDGRLMQANVQHATDESLLHIGTVAVLTVMQWTEISFSFAPLPCAELAQLAAMGSPGLLLPGERTAEPEIVVAPHSYLVPNWQVRLLDQPLTLGEWEALSKVGAVTTVAQLAATLGAPAGIIPPVIKSLLALGLIKQTVLCPTPAVLATNPPLPPLMGLARRLPTLQSMRQAIKQRLGGGAEE